MPPGESGRAIMFETPHRDFREDRVVIESDGAPSEPFAGNQRRSRMGEWIEHGATFARRAPNDPLNRLQRLLGIAAGHILMHSVEDLLDVYPDIARANRIPLCTFVIFGAAAADLLVIAPQNLRDVGIFCGDIEAGLATSI